MAAFVHPSISLGYSFPSKNGFTKYDESLLMELQVAEALKLDDQPKSSAPKFLSKPLSKSYPGTCKPKIDPLAEILAASRNIISQYPMRLSSSTSTNEEQTTPYPSKKLVMTPRSIRTGPIPMYRKRARTEDENQKPNELYNDSAMDLQNTPIPNKTIYFGSHSKALSRRTSQIFGGLSTPSKVKENPSIQKLLTGDWAQVVSGEKGQSINSPMEPINNQLIEAEFGASTPSKANNNLPFSPLGEDDDQLACHADKILRMAVDSTMLGSSYNHSLSFNNSLNDSMMVPSRKKNHQIDIFDDNDPEKSLLELRKQKWNVLSRDKATKIEINEDDLKNILGDV